MSTIGSLKRYSQASRVCGFEIGRPGASASDVAAGHVPAGNARIPASRDFSVAAYQRLDVEECRAVAPRFRAFPALRRIASAILQRLLVAMLESRREQAAVMLAPMANCSRRLSDPSVRGPRNSTGNTAQTSCVRSDMRFGQAGDVLRIRCSITGAPCDGDLADLCDEWGCVRKAGLSPVSHENL